MADELARARNNTYSGCSAVNETNMRIKKPRRQNENISAPQYMSDLERTT